MSKKRHLYIIVLVLFLTVVISLACGIVSKQSETDTQEREIATLEIEKPKESPINELAKDSSRPNLDAVALLVDEKLIGNGMKRIGIALGGINDSSNWWDYSFGRYQPCSWSAGRPILQTEQGYPYEAKKSLDKSSCGTKFIWEIPPGAWFLYLNILESSSQDLEQMVPWGLAYFDIPETSTPAEITFHYGSGYYNSEVEIIKNSVTTKVIPENKWNPPDHPFDLNLIKPYQYELGQIIEVGDLATVVFESPGVQHDGTLPVEMIITSQDEAYPLEFSSSAIFEIISLIIEPGIHCCGTSPLIWLWNDKPRKNILGFIGPSQTVRLSSTFSDLEENQTIWFIGKIPLIEKEGSREAEARFVIQID
jgi:hypothetical protein